MFDEFDEEDEDHTPEVCLLCKGTLLDHEIGCVDPLIRMQTCEALAELIAVNLGVVCLGHKQKESYLAVWPLKVNDHDGEEKFAISRSSKSMTNAIITVIGMAQERQDVFYTPEEARERVKEFMDEESRRTQEDDEDDI